MKTRTGRFAAGVLALASQVNAADLLVPSQYSSIQAAVNAAADGDRVVLAPGTYNETTVITGKAITIASSGGASVTKVDRQGSGGSVFTFTQFLAGQTASIRGITISRCSDTAIVMNGGSLNLADVRVLSGARGVQLTGSSSSIHATRYQAVALSSPGAGAYLAPGASAVFDDCNFTNCNGHEGAAIYGEGSNTVEVRGSRFSNCLGVNGTIRLSGAGIMNASDCTWTGCTGGSFSCAYLLGTTAATFDRCEFLSNSAIDIYSNSTGTVTVRDSLQEGGRGDRHSFLYTNTGPVILERVTARDSGGYVDGNQMGGWMLSEGGRVTMIQCVFTNYSVSGNGAVHGGVLRAYGGAQPVTISECAFHMNDSAGPYQSALRVEGRPLEVRETQFTSSASTYMHSPVRAISCPTVLVEDTSMIIGRITRAVWAENVSSLVVRDSEFRKPGYEWENHFIYLNGTSTRSTSLIERCTFTRGVHAIYREPATADSSLEVRQCSFQDNIASPSAIYCNNIPVSVYDCFFRSGQYNAIRVDNGQIAFLGGNYFCGTQLQELGTMPIVVKEENGFSMNCAEDCDVDGIPDDYEIDSGLESDCDSNGVPDNCDADGGGSDCNGNGVPDACDIASGALDCDGNGVPDSCQQDCDSDGTPDACEIASGAPDCDLNEVPDSCQPDCDGDGVIDVCAINAGANDCNGNLVPDSCEISLNPALDLNFDGLLDTCQPEMQFDGLQLEVVPIVNRGTDDLFPASAVCYRLYVRVKNPAASTVGIFGNAANPLRVSALGGFWQSEFGADFTNSVECSQPKAPESARFDSWFGIGLDCADGNATQNVGVDLSGFNSGGSISDDDCIVFVVPGSPQALGGSAKRVLVAQFTTAQPVFPVGTINVLGTSSFGAGAENSWIAFAQPIPMPALVDCNANGEHDAFDIARGTSLDCDQSGVPDTCEHTTAVTDCNGNGISDLCDCYSGYSSDINTNNVPDECECAGDVDGNGRVDSDDIISVLVSWGDGAESDADLNSDGLVNGGDLGIVLAGWGNCL